MHKPKEKTQTPLDGLVRQIRPVIWHVGAISFFISLLVLPVSLYSLQVFDRVMATGSLPTLFWLSAIMIALFAAAGFLQSMRGIMLQQLGDWVHDAMAQHVLPITLAQASQPGGSKGAQGLRDAGMLRQFLSGPGLVTLFDAPWAVLYIAILFLIHPLLGVLVTVGAIVLLALAWLNEALMHRSVKSAGQQQMQSAQELEFATRNAEVIEAMGMAQTLIARWRELQQKANAAQGQAGSRSSVIQGITKFVRLTLQILVTGVSAWLALEGHLTMGAIIASSILSSRALAPFEAAISSWKSLSETRNAYARLQHLLGVTVREEGMSLPEPNGAFAVENLIYVTAEKQPLLRNVNFALEPGESLGIAGHSGAGKSTLARLMMGIWKPAGGIVRLDGADVYSWPRDEFGEYVGYLPQDVELFAGTVKDNIARLKSDAPSEAIVEAAKLANAHELILRLPKGYDTEIGVGGSLLSAGQRQRIGLARAFYGSPRLLVLDEPDASLDDAGIEALLLAIKQAKLKRITLIMITHRRSLLVNLDKLMVMKSGAVEAFGPTQKIISDINNAMKIQAEKP